MDTFTRYQFLGLRNGELNEPIINFPPRYYCVTSAGNGQDGLWRLGSKSDLGKLGFEKAFFGQGPRLGQG